MIDFSEEALDKVLLNNNTNRKIIDNPEDSGWGQLIIPGCNENPNKSDKGLRVLLIASYKIGLLLVKTLIEFEKKYPNKINIVGLITDDPVNPHAKISMKRRIWRLFDDKQKMDIEDSIIELALSNGVPCYTGAIKTNYARKLLSIWNPDTIQVCVFGQIIDAPIINYPSLGIYNYHPADLAHHHGAGPQPFQDLIDRDALTSLFTIHQLTVELDAGPILGQSPTINVRNSDGTISNNILILEDKVTEPLDIMAILLNRELIKQKTIKPLKPIYKFDFAKYFGKDQKRKLMEPIKTGIHDEDMPVLSNYAIKLLDKIN